MYRAFASVAALICGAGVLLGQIVQQVHVTQTVADGLVVHRTQVHYPGAARADGAEGMAAVQVVIAKDGSIKDATVIGGDPRLTTAVVDSIKQWKFKPYLLHGTPVEVNTDFTFVFSSADPLFAKEFTPQPGKQIAGPVVGISKDGTQHLGMLLEDTAPGTHEQPKQPVPTRIRVSEGVSQALLMERIEPKYPAEARKTHVEGSVAVKITIGTDGSVQKAEVLNGDPMLESAAIDAVKQWKYKPYLLNEHPIQVDTIATVVFKLNSEQGSK